MIRRLHFEEAQPSPQAINPAGQTAESRDDPEDNPLALEFKKLLEQISGGMAAVSDQAMAMGLALAQAAPLERTVRHELKSSDKSHDAAHSDDDKDLLDDRDIGQKDSFIRMNNDDSGKRADTRATLTEDDHESSGSRATVANATQDQFADNTATQVVDVEGLEDISQGLIETISDANKVIHVELCPETQATEESVEVNSVQLDQTAVVDEERSVTFDAQAAVITRAETKVKTGGEKKEKESEDELTDLTAVNTSSAETGVDNLKKVTQPLSKDSTRERNYGDGPLTGQPFDVAQQSMTAVRAFSKNNRPEDAQVNFATSAQQKDVEGAQKANRLKHEKSFEEPETVSAPITKMTNRPGEGAIQMTLLRQAFESLKAGRQEGADGRAKPTTPSMTGVGAAPEAKSAQNDSSARASRGMNKAQTARMLERVEATLKEAARARDGKTISLRLDPANLGRVKVDVSLRDGSLHAKISPENQQVMVALRENAHDLQGALRKLGLHVDSVSVTVTSEYVKEEATTGQQQMDGRSFQQERNKMPRETGQVLENTAGNELAERREVQAPGQANAVVDHWVA